jgi:hypothetical protein
MPFHLVRILLVMPALLLSSAVVAVTPRAMHARVVAVSAIPSTTSGFMVNWITLTVVEDGKSVTSKLKLAYVSAQTRVPNAGEYCFFTVHDERSGSTRDVAGLEVDDSTVIDEFHCSWRQ